MISWDENYSVGDETIDRQHKLLFDFCNDLEEIIAASKHNSYIATGLPFLENYAIAHFHFEESCMNRHKCHVAPKNKKAHEEFLEKLNQFRRKAEQEPQSGQLVIDMHRFLEEWITSHIIGLDKHLKECIAHNQT